MSGIVPWPPTRYTEPLRPDFECVFDRFAKAFAILWVDAFGYALEEWQVQLLRAITELRPDGHLRYRQVLISLGRQNGKTEILAALGLLFLLWKKAPYVIGIATTAEQARLVYDRAGQAISRNRALRKRFDRMTDTRGLSTKTGGKWELKAAKSAALQGIPIDLGAADELHLIKRVLWTDLLNGTGGRPDCLVAGITTAGDDSSELLLWLYGLDAASFGRFIWEAPEARMPDDDETLGDYLKAANPAIASGRIDLATVIEDVRAMPPKDAIRYRLNRFVDGKSDDLFSMSDWATLRSPTGVPWPSESPLYFAVDAPFGLETAVIAAAAKEADDSVRSELVAGYVRPSLGQLADACARLYERHTPASFIVDGYSGKDLAAELQRRGLPVIVTSHADMLSACALLYSKVMRHSLRHGGDDLLTMQLPSAQRKAIGDAWRITPRKGARFGIDAIMATAIALWAAETQHAAEMQLF